MKNKSYKSFFNMKPILLAVQFIVLFTILSGCNDKGKISTNPNSKSYKKTVVSQDEFELEKIKSTHVKTRKIYSKFSNKYIRGGGKEILVERTNFDEEGYRSEQFRYISNGDVDLQWLFNYDYYNRLVRAETLDGYRQRVFMKEINYNSEGTIDKVEEWTEKSGDFKTTKYIYDDNQNLKEVKHFDTKGRINSSEIYSYKDDKLDTLYYLNAKNDTLSKIHLKYDSLGRREKEISIDASGKIRTTEIVYDGNNNIVALNNDVLSSFKYTYDDKNNLILEEEFNSQGFLQSKFVYEYDPDRNITIKKIRFDGEDDEALLVRYEYEFY